MAEFFGSGSAGGAASIVVGNPVTGGDPYDVLYIDANGKLGADSKFWMDPALSSPATSGLDGGTDYTINLGATHAEAVALNALGLTYQNGFFYRCRINNMNSMSCEFVSTQKTNEGFYYRVRRQRASGKTTSTGDYVGGFYGEGWDANATAADRTPHPLAQIDMWQDGAAASSSVPGAIDLSCVNGSGTVQVVMCLRNNGRVGIGDAMTAQTAVNATLEIRTLSGSHNIIEQKGAGGAAYLGTFLTYSGTSHYFIGQTSAATDDYQIQDLVGGKNPLYIFGNNGGIRIGDTGGKVGFYVTAPIALQTGVAVSAAGIHAALVNLGLITA